MTLLVTKIDGDILTGGNWTSIKQESNPFFFGNENSGTVVLSTNTNMTADWDVSILTINSGVTLTVTSGKRLRVGSILTLVDNATILANYNPLATPGSPQQQPGAQTCKGSGGGSGVGVLHVYTNYLSGAGKKGEFWPADLHLLGKEIAGFIVFIGQHF